MTAQNYKIAPVCPLTSYRPSPTFAPLLRFSPDLVKSPTLGNPVLVVILCLLLEILILPFLDLYNCKMATIFQF